MAQADLPILQDLLDNYADVNQGEPTQGDLTPLMAACQIERERDALEVVKLLCSHRHYVEQEKLANVDLQDTAGNTALHYAAM